MWGVFFSPFLKVGNVKAIGIHETTTLEVTEAASSAVGRNILLVNTAEVAAAVEALPWVAQADVDRILPNTLRIRVSERVPAIVLTIGAARWTLDASGVVLTSGTPVKGLPEIAGLPLDEVEPGRRIEGPEARGALSVWTSLPRPIKSTVEAIFAPTIERITVSLAGGTLIRYGAPERMAEKNEVLATILARLEAEGTSVEYIDIRVPTSPALGPTTGGAGDGADAPP